MMSLIEKRAMVPVTPIKMASATSAVRPLRAITSRKILRPRVRSCIGFVPPWARLARLAEGLWHSFTNCTIDRAEHCDMGQAPAFHVHYTHIDAGGGDIRPAIASERLFTLCLSQRRDFPPREQVNHADE